MTQTSISAALEFSVAVHALNEFEHRFNFATAEMSRCLQTASQALIDFSIRELKQMTDCLAEVLGVSQGLPRRNSKASLACWVAEMLLSAISVEDDAIVEAAKSDEAIVELDDESEDDESSGFNYVQIGAIDLDELTEKRNRLWLKSLDESYKAFFVEITSSQAFLNEEACLTKLTIQEINPTEVFPIEDVLMFATTELIVVCKSLLSPQDTDNLNSVCQRHSLDRTEDPLNYYLNENQAVYYHDHGVECDQLSALTAIKCVECNHSSPVEPEFTQDEMSKPEPLVPVSPEILPPESKPVFKIRLFTVPLSSEFFVSRIPPYLVDKFGDLFQKDTFSNDSAFDADYHLVFSEHLSNIQEGLLGTDVQLLCDSLSVENHNINGAPPPYLITSENCVYQRLKYQTKPSIVQYAQVISEYLSNIEVVAR